MTRKGNLIIIATLFITNIAYADSFQNNMYVSPESYAVNEADMQIDYSRIPPAPKLDLDTLDDMRFQTPNLVEKDFQIGKDETEVSTKVKKSKKHKKEIDDEAYKKKLSYKFAKWWVDQRYKREEAHHGSLHEIKVQKRLDYEKAKEEKEQQKREQEEI